MYVHIYYINNEADIQMHLYISKLRSTGVGIVTINGIYISSISKQFEKGRSTTNKGHIFKVTMGIILYRDVGAYRSA